MIWQWLLHAYYHVSGADNEGGTAYGSWSGIAGATACFAWIPASAVIYRHNNCHQHRCWRLGRHPVGDAGIRVCRRHHPELGRHRRLTADVIAEHHERTR